MKIIVAVDRNWAIGKGNSLLAHLPGDLKHFREKTLGKTVVMGRQTLESFPGGKPLPGRTNIVLTTNEDYPADCEICCSKEHLFQCLDNCDLDQVFIIGGEQIYREFLSHCDRAYVTKIDAAFRRTSISSTWMNIRPGSWYRERTDNGERLCLPFHRIRTDIVKRGKQLSDLL